MKGIPAMNKRGGKEVAQTSSRSGNAMGVPSSLSNRKGNNGAAAPSRTGNESGISSAFYEGRGGKEYATKVGR